MRVPAWETKDGCAVNPKVCTFGPDTPPIASFIELGLPVINRDDEVASAISEAHRRFPQPHPLSTPRSQLHSPSYDRNKGHPRRWPLPISRHAGPGPNNKNLTTLVFEVHRCCVLGERTYSDHNSAPSIPSWRGAANRQRRCRYRLIVEQLT